MTYVPSQPAPLVYVNGELPAPWLSGVLTRRVLAVCIDFLFVGIIVAAIWVVATLLTLGLALLFMPPLFPIIAFFYNGLTVSGASMATPGMRVFDIVARDSTTLGRVGFLQAAVQAVLFYLSWMFPFVLLIAPFMPNRRCLHDIFSGVVVTRRG